jgi:hypothetical protein
MSERRFNEAEVAAIFERATEAQQTSQRQLPTGEGMTLAELQDIGREVGISPELVARAVKTIEQGGQPTSRSFLGFTIGVGRTVDLDRRLTEDEWERLVVDLRETFDARGTIRHEGSLRQWTNGNLQALLEPTATGHRVRLRTLKGSARSYMAGGLMMIGISAVSVISAMLRGPVTDAGMFSALGFLGVMGAGMFAAGALGLPRWARLRRQQMEDVAARLTATSEHPTLT